MTRVLFIIRQLVQGGAERQLIELAKRLDKSRFQVGVVCFYPGGGLWEEAKSASGIEIWHIGKSGRWDLSPFWKLPGLMGRYRPQIVHGYMGISNLIALLGKMFGAKIVWGIRASNVDFSRYDLLSRLAFRLESRLSRLPDLIICNSEAGRSHVLAHGFPAGRTIVIPNGIDTARFRPDPAGRQRLRAEWHVEADELLIGLPARLDPMKGHAVFLATAAKVGTHFEKVRFVCIGDGPETYRLEMMQQADRLGLQNRLIWAGPHTDMPAVISALDLAVSASIFGEGFSNALAEAMACGVPCVATNVGDSAKILGGMGWLARPNDPEDLADKLCAAVMTFEQGGGAPGTTRAHIESHFSSEKLARTTADILTDLTTHE